jgi:hypothetical protein
MCLGLVACSPSPKSAPDPVFVPPIGPYGWAHTFEPGATLTDGGPILEITTGPIRITSITIKASGAKVTVPGIYIRSLHPAVPFTGALGFRPMTPHGGEVRSPLSVRFSTAPDRVRHMRISNY